MSDFYGGAEATQAPPDPIFVGIDLSMTSTGIATIHGDQITTSRVTSKPTRGDTGTESNRLRLIVREILEHVPYSDVTYVGIEGPSYGSQGNGQHIRGGLWWLLRGELDHWDIDTIIVPPASVKKYATGKGNAGKDEVLAAVIRRYPQVDVRGNDEADALAIAALTARYHGFPIDNLPKVNLDAVKGVGR